MTKKDFDTESFGYLQYGNTGFISGDIYGKKYKHMHEKTAHLKRCFDCAGEHYEDGKKITPKWTKNSKSILIRLWLEAIDLDDFINKIKKDKEASLTHFAGEILKDDRDFLKSFLNAEKTFITSSDAGGVKIGNDSFSIIIPNGYGDTFRNRVSINTRNSFNSSAFRFWSSIDGENINIYDYDCGGEIVATISGRFGVYYNDRIVIFEEWSK